MEVGKTKLDDWRVGINKAHLSRSFSCEGQICASEVSFENKLLHRLHLAPRSSVRAEVQFKGGIASEIYVWVEMEDAPDAAGVMYPGTGATAPSC